jgi:hypothetical protein
MSISPQIFLGPTFRFIIIIVFMIKIGVLVLVAFFATARRGWGRALSITE